MQLKTTYFGLCFNLDPMWGVPTSHTEGQCEGKQVRKLIQSTDLIVPYFCIMSRVIATFTCACTVHSNF